MDTSYRSEREVEVNLLRPLFHDVLGYPEKELAWDAPVRITFGRETRTKQADLVVSYHSKPVIAVEAKKPTESVQSGLSQVDSYAFALETPYSVITNGKHLVLRGYYSFNSRINVIDESVDQLRDADWTKLRNLISFATIPSAISEPANPITLPDEEKIKDYRRFFRKIHSAIRDRDRLDPAAAFDELSKLLFLKAAEDEWRLRAKSKPVLSPEKIAEWEKLGQGRAEALVNEWFHGATEELFPGVFDDHPRITLSPGTLKVVLEMMRPFHVKDGDIDVKGRAFEEFLPSQLRGKGLGQYFTPRPVVNFMAALASISIRDVVVDFSCGSGGFLIKAFDQMQREVEQLPAGTLRRIGTTKDEILEDIKSRQIFGIDAEPRAARTAKMNMLMWGDGRRVVRGNALDVADFSGRPYEPQEYSAADESSGCTLILANPPFGSKEKDVSVLNRYVLGSKFQERVSESTEILFLEKGVKLLRPEGKMLIVLPQGLMSGLSNARVRDYLHSEVEIRAIVSMPTHTFVQSGVATVNTCVVYVQKYTKAKKQLYDEKMAGLTQEDKRKLLRVDPDFDYPIFMGTAEFIGYEPSGRMIVAPGEETDLDILLRDFEHQTEIHHPNVNVFEFATQNYADKPSRRKDQVVRGTVKGLQTSFVVSLSETEDRLDPPFYLLRCQAGDLIESLEPLREKVQEVKSRFRPKTDDELDAEYPILSVSSDGKVTLNEYLRGEEFTQPYKRVRANDIVYNPSRINIGSVGVVPKDLDASYVSPEYVVVRAQNINPAFLVALLRSPFYRMYIDVVSTGSIRDRLYFRDLRELRIPDVESPEQVAITEAIRRSDDETLALLSKVATEKANVTGRLHGLVTASDVITADAARRAEAFRALAERWRRETGFSSSVTKKIRHPAYLQIVRMGMSVVPLILRELRERPAHWFVALEQITGESPQAESRGDVRSNAQAWIKWGKQHGYLD